MLLGCHLLLADHHRPCACVPQVLSCLLSIFLREPLLDWLKEVMFMPSKVRWGGGEDRFQS